MNRVLVGFTLSATLWSFVILPEKFSVAADRFTEQVRTQLIRVVRSAGYGGYGLTHEPFIGDLGNGGEDDLNLNLKAGVSYAIVGVCDQDCSDLDLKIYDDNGNVVASDVQKDDFPVVKVEPRWNARFRLKIYMPSCRNAPCRYGIGVFGR
ncbi:MAG: hypothetical protein U7127_03585 [Phormidium sp.]